MTDHNGMTDHEQPPIPLRTAWLAVVVTTSAAVEWGAATVERVSDAIWRALPPAEDGDVEIKLIREERE